MDALARAHSQAYVRDIIGSIPESGFASLDSDTLASPGTGDAALRAAGAVILAIDMIMAGGGEKTVFSVRPPPPHPPPPQAKGVFLFYKIAARARPGRALRGLARL